MKKPARMIRVLLAAAAVEIFAWFAVGTCPASVVKSIAESALFLAFILTLAALFVIALAFPPKR